MTRTREIPEGLDNGERMIPDAHRDAVVYIEHIVRYEFAARLLRGKSVLDVACGSGYGSEVLAQAGAHSVVGVDLSPEASRYADGRYSSDSTSFLAGDAEHLPFRAASFDVIVSFETIEHLHDPFSFLSEVKRLLKPDGLLVISSPNKGVFIEGNPFHVHEFTYDELDVALTSRFSNVNSLLQNDWIASAILTQATTAREGDASGVETRKFASLQPRESLYVVSVCSDGPLPSTEELIALGNVYEMKGFMHEAESLRGEIAELRKLWSVIAEKDQHISNYADILAEKDGHIENALKAVAEKDRDIGDLQRQLSRKEAELRTWRRIHNFVTLPARAVRRIAGRGRSNK